MTVPYPLIFDPILKEKVWGGRRLESVGKALPPNVNIGESWELADMATTSASGGGGGSAVSTIVNGSLAGRTIRDATAAWGQDLLGPAKLTPTGGFPLLVKFLDAREDLSVQVHPSPAYAAAHPEANLKTECWSILAATPGAVLYKGIRPGVTREAFARHIADNTVVGDMIAVPAIVGECHNLPSGTCHALGAGVLAAEIQTPSDTTFRVYDWGRRGRELHVAQALACIDFGPAPGPASIPAGDTRGRLVTTEYFVVDGLRLPAGAEMPLAFGPRATVVMMLEGSGTLTTAAGRTPLRAGQTALVPACLADLAGLTAGAAVNAMVARV
jgi:mannose-6-phosphate isomerase